jgi:hypothetical protein
MPTIAISRDSGWGDRLREYRILVDGVEMARVGNGETMSLAISAGKHELSLKISWCGSNTVRFEIFEDQSLRFSCGSSLRGTRLLLAYYYVLFAPHEYLWFKAE